MPMLKNPSAKYSAFKPINLPDRTWPNKTITAPPRWLSTDLRDGNQSLVNPMDGDQKREYFNLLVELGYKEIEVSFPSASDTDFDFTRWVIEQAKFPDDVWIQVLSPCRKELISRTFESLRGAKKAIVHLYLATSPCFQRIVFNMENKDTKALAVECTRYARELANSPEYAGTEWAFEFSPETFSDSNLDFVVDVCEAVKAAWGPTESNPIIFNLPATVEMSTPNVYADQIEYFSRHISDREKVCVSLHPHNDRGCAVAAAELAQMAGAQRVEGTLFGNGERTGNVDLVTLALNLYTQGIYPAIDFSDITHVIDVVERNTGIPVHQRAPYGGQLVVCAFSGSHQDAIKKGFTIRETEKADDSTRWEVPYLPIDPKDIGRTYEAVIRVNSQSGKGGVAYLIHRELGLNLPRGLQVDFSHVVQKRADACGKELLPTEIATLFKETYFLDEFENDAKLGEYSVSNDDADPDRPRRFTGVVTVRGVEKNITGTGNGPVSSFADALSTIGITIDVTDYSEHSIGEGRDVKAVAYLQCNSEGKQVVWGVGIDHDTSRASLLAILSAASVFYASRPASPNLSPSKK